MTGSLDGTLRFWRDGKCKYVYDYGMPVYSLKIYIEKEDHTVGLADYLIRGVYFENDVAFAREYNSGRLEIRVNDQPRFDLVINE